MDNSAAYGLGGGFGGAGGINDTPEPVGSIMPFFLSISLIIRHTAEVHGEIEDLLQTHPKVAAVAVIGLPDRDRGERVCAVVETAVDSSLTFPEMQRFCRDSGLMVQKIPEQLEVVDLLPRNATFKILKHELVKQFTEVSA